MSNLEALKLAVLNKQKTLAEIYNGQGSLSLFNYVNAWPAAVPLPPSSPVLAYVREALESYYPPAVAAAAAGQFAAAPLVSTVDHHGLLNHPFFINSNLIFSLRQNQPYLICLATGGVSLNNSSWPGSLVFTGPGGGLRRLSFFSDRQKTGTVLAQPPLKLEQFDQFRRRLREEGLLSQAQKERLLTLLTDVFGDKEVGAAADFLGQSARASRLLWKNFFPTAPEVLYLPLEQLIGRLAADIAGEPGHPLYPLLFSAAGLGLIGGTFAGSLGAFSSGHKGSFLFWGLAPTGRRIHLRHNAGCLEGDGFSLKAEPGAVAAALRQGRLYPTTLVCFLILLYYGVTCAGGFNQVNWLTDIKQKFLRLFAKAGLKDAAAAIGPIETKNFLEGSLGFFPGLAGQDFSLATGLDLYLAGQDFYHAYLQLAKQLALKDSIDCQLPEIYRVITPAEERQPELLAVTAADIFERAGLRKKVDSLNFA